MDNSTSEKDIEDIINANWATIYKILYRKLYSKYYYNNNQSILKNKSLANYHSNKPQSIETIIENPRPTILKKEHRPIVIDFHK
jgi:hypothetical protein